MKNKISAFIISLLITVVSFLFILYIEQKIFNPNGTDMVYVVKADKLEKNHVINEENFDQLFVNQERRSDQIVENYIKDKEDLYGAILTSTMYKNEIISTDKIGYIEDDLNELTEKREVSIKATDISSVVGGILREGDRVDLIVTSKSGGNIETEKRLENLYISKVYDSSGNEIKREEKSKHAFGITFTVSGETAKEVENAINLDSWKLVKVIND